MEFLEFYASVPFPPEGKREIAEKMDYTYHILNFEFPKKHSHADYWEFSILLDGEINYTLNGNREVIKKGTLFYSTTKDYHFFRCKDKKNLRYLNILAKEKPLLALLNSISPSFADLLLNGNHSWAIPDPIIFSVEEILHKANMLSSKQYETHSKLILSALMLILQFLFSQHIEPFEMREEWEEVLSVAMQNKEFLSYKIPDLCSLLNYSKSQLNRVFQKRFGISPHEYLINYKFRYARNMLSHSKVKVIDIATQVGYKNLSQFNLIFKKKFGLTPSEYRKRNNGDSIN